MNNILHIKDATGNHTGLSVDIHDIYFGQILSAPTDVRMHCVLFDAAGAAVYIRPKRYCVLQNINKYLFRIT